MKRLVETCLRTVTLAILLAFVVSPTLVRAANYNLGVKVGDWIKFGQVSVTWSGSGTEPSYVTDDKKMDWTKIEFENINGTAVTVNVTYHYNNETQTSQSGVVDVNGGTYYPGSRYLIAANLSSGDPLSTQPNSPTINQTTTGRYAGASRNVNSIETTSGQGNQMTTYKTYWDQTTGAMVEFYLKEPDYTNPTGAYVEISLKATETNLWSTDIIGTLSNLIGTLSNNLIYIIIGIVLAAFVIVAEIIFRRTHPAPPPTSARKKGKQPSTRVEGYSRVLCYFRAQTGTRRRTEARAVQVLPKATYNYIW